MKKLCGVIEVLTNSILRYTNASNQHAVPLKHTILHVDHILIKK